MPPGSSGGCCARPGLPEGRVLVVNADDFGASEGVNRGIIDCHQKGIVTSTSLMVTGRATTEAVALSNRFPTLGIGLHWDVCGEDERDFDLEDHEAVRGELRRQIEEFHRLLGRTPTHVDSHRHVHLEPGLLGLFREMIAPLGVPLRGDGRVNVIGGFYAQWEWKVTNLEYIGLPFLQHLLRAEVLGGWNELSCHPGYASAGYESVYGPEREVEVTTLTNPTLRSTLQQLGIRLASYADYKPARPEEG